MITIKNGYSSPAAQGFWDPISVIVWLKMGMMSYAWIIFHRHQRNIRHLIGRPNFELIRHDLVHPIFLEVDEIYNLACPASPIHYQYNPVKTVKTSVMGAINMLGLAKRVKAKILQASTSEVYGNPQCIPKRKITGAMSTPSVPGPVMMRESVAPRHSFSIIIGRTGSTSGWSGSSILMARGCTRTTAG